MQRRAHGGAWGAAALLIGSCSFVEAGEPIPKLKLAQAPAHYSSGTVSGNLVSADPVASSVSSFTAARGPAASSGVASLEILPTPFVPSAATLSQSAGSYPGKLFAPTTVANLSQPPQALNPQTLSSSTSGFTPSNLAGATATANDVGAVTIVGPMVPLNLSPQEKELLEKALRGLTTPTTTTTTTAGTTSTAAKTPADNENFVDAKTAGTEKPAKIDKTAEIKSSEIKNAVVAKPEKIEPPAKTRTAKERLLADAGTEATTSGAADESAAETNPPAAAVKPKISGESAAKIVAAAPPTNSSNTISTAGASTTPKPVTSGEGKIVPLPPLEREVPSSFALPVNLPQPPIPLEFPRTGS